MARECGENLTRPARAVPDVDAANTSQCQHNGFATVGAGTIPISTDPKALQKMATSCDIAQVTAATTFGRAAGFVFQVQPWAYRFGLIVVYVVFAASAVRDVLVGIRVPSFAWSRGQRSFLSCNIKLV